MQKQKQRSASIPGRSHALRMWQRAMAHACSFVLVIHATVPTQHAARLPRTCGHSSGARGRRHPPLPPDCSCVMSSISRMPKLYRSAATVHRCPISCSGAARKGEAIHRVNLRAVVPLAAKVCAAWQRPRNQWVTRINSHSGSRKAETTAVAAAADSGTRRSSSGHSSRRQAHLHTPH